MDVVKLNISQNYSYSIQAAFPLQIAAVLRIFHGITFESFGCCISEQAFLKISTLLKFYYDMTSVVSQVLGRFEDSPERKD